MCSLLLGIEEAQLHFLKYSTRDGCFIGDNVMHLNWERVIVPETLDPINHQGRQYQTEAIFVQSNMWLLITNALLKAGSTSQHRLHYLRGG